MKNAFKPKLLLLSGIALLISGCTQPEEAFGETSPTVKAIAMEMYLHYIALEQTNYLNRQLHHDFLSPEVVSRLQQHPFYAAKLNKIENEPTDSVYSYDEIPAIRETKTHTVIYDDGTSESFFEDLTPHDQNVLFHLNETPHPNESRIVATRLKNGWLTAYGPDQKVLFEEPYLIDNQREFLDTLEVYVRKSLLPQHSAPLHDQDLLRMLRMTLPDGATVTKLPGGNLRMEMIIHANDQHDQVLQLQQGVLKSSTELNPEMTRTLKFELYQGDFLLQRKVYSYDDTPLLKNRYQEQDLAENPITIISHTLAINSQGMPVLRHTHEYYYRNQSFYYFK